MRLEDDVNNAKRKVEEGGMVVKEFDSKDGRSAVARADRICVTLGGPS